MVDTVVGRELAKRGCAFGEASDCHTFHHGLLNDFLKKTAGVKKHLLFSSCALATAVGGLISI